MTDDGTMKNKQPPTFKSLAADLARESIVTKCLARFLEQVIEEVHDTQIKPLRAALQRIADQDVDADLKGQADVLAGIAWAALNDSTAPVKAGE